MSWRTKGHYPFLLKFNRGESFHNPPAHRRGNPGTPAYVGMIGIIMRRQKNTSGYIGITTLLVKLA